MGEKRERETGPRQTLWLFGRHSVNLVAHSVCVHAFMLTCFLSFFLSLLSLPFFVLLSFPSFPFLPSHCLDFCMDTDTIDISLSFLLSFPLSFLYFLHPPTPTPTYSTHPHPRHSLCSYPSILFHVHLFFSFARSLARSFGRSYLFSFLISFSLLLIHSHTHIHKHRYRYRHRDTHNTPFTPYSNQFLTSAPLFVSTFVAQKLYPQQEKYLE